MDIYEWEQGLIISDYMYSATGAHK